MLFDNLNHRFVMRQEFTLVPQPVYMPRGIIPKSLVRPFLVVLVDIPAKGQTGDLGRGIRGIAVNLFLLDCPIPAFLPGIVGRPMGAARRKNHLQIPNEPPGAVGHVGRP